MYNHGDTNLGAGITFDVSNIIAPQPEVSRTATTTKTTTTTSFADLLPNLVNSGFSVYNQYKMLEYQKKQRQQAEILAQQFMSAQMAQAAAAKREAMIKARPLTVGEARRVPTDKLFGMDTRTVMMVGGAGLLGLFAFAMIPKRKR